VLIKKTRDKPESIREREDAGADGSIAYVENRHPRRVILAAISAWSLHLPVSWQNTSENLQNSSKMIVRSLHMNSSLGRPPPPPARRTAAKAVSLNPSKSQQNAKGAQKIFRLSSIPLKLLNYKRHKSQSVTGISRPEQLYCTNCAPPQN